MPPDNLAIGLGLVQDCVALSKREGALIRLSGILQITVGVMRIYASSQMKTDPFHAVSGRNLTEFIRIIEDFEICRISEFY